MPKIAKAIGKLQRENSGDREFDYWYIGDNNTEYRNILPDSYPNILDDAMVIPYKRGLEQAWKICAQAAKALEMDEPVVFLVDLSDEVYIAKYLNGSHRVFVIDPDKHPCAKEMKLSLLHELAHAFLDRMDLIGLDLYRYDEEEIAEIFAQDYLEDPQNAVDRLRDDADGMLEYLEIKREDEERDKEEKVFPK